jgi:6-phospho-beta-glucosidase
MLVESLRLNRGDVQIVNVRNAGAIPTLDAGAVVEVPCRIAQVRRRAAAAAPAPRPRCSALVEQVKAYER